MFDLASPPQVIGGLQGLEGDALAGLFLLGGSNPRWTNRTSLLNVGGPMLGGHIAAIGMKAAMLSAEGAMPTALHVLFVSAPDPSRSCELQVEALRDGRRLAHRTTRVVQGGQMRALVTATLGRPALTEDAPPFRFDGEPPAAPSPDTLPTRGEILAVMPHHAASLETRILAGHPYLDIRFVPRSASDNGRALFWVRVPDSGQLDPVDHFCMLAVISDYWCTLPVHNLPGAKAAFGVNMTTTSLDHALWFHSAPDCTGWMLFEMHVISVSDGIATMQARAWDREGRAIASCLQHALAFAVTA